MGVKVLQARWDRWYSCSLCEQNYHGVVRCALGWACWKTYVGRPETDRLRMMAMNQLGSGLASAGHHEDALSVQEAELSMMRRLGADEDDLLIAQGNLAITYEMVGRLEDGLRIRQDVYLRRLEFFGEEKEETLIAANNYAATLIDLKRFEEVRSLMRGVMPVARRVLGESDALSFRMRWSYAEALYSADGATLDDVREAVATLEDTERTARRVLGGAHPTVVDVERALRNARAALRARESLHT